MSMVERAILLATAKHAGQVDKVGEPYILHPLRVMLAVPPKEELRVIAVMHDLIEDTDVTSVTLFNEGFEQPVIDAILALSRKPEESYEEFIVRCKKNRRARVVKRCDIGDNLRAERMRGLDKPTRDRLTARYMEAMRILS